MSGNFLSFTFIRNSAWHNLFRIYVQMDKSKIYMPLKWGHNQSLFLIIKDSTWSLCHHYFLLWYTNSCQFSNIILLWCFEHTVLLWDMSQLLYTLSQCVLYLSNKCIQCMHVVHGQSECGLIFTYNLLLKARIWRSVHQ